MWPPLGRSLSLPGRPHRRDAARHCMGSSAGDDNELVLLIAATSGIHDELNVLSRLSSLTVSSRPGRCSIQLL